jgi:hypothetical protein
VSTDWDRLVRDRAEEALAVADAFADAFDEQAVRNRWTAAVAEAELVAARWGSGHWTGRAS